MCKAVHVNEREKVWGWCVREIWRERERGMDKAWQQIDTNASSKMNKLMFKRVSICHLLAQISTWIQCVVINILCSLPLSTWISLSLPLPLCFYIINKSLVCKTDRSLKCFDCIINLIFLVGRRFLWLAMPFKCVCLWVIFRIADDCSCVCVP